MSTRPMWTGTEYCRFRSIGQCSSMVSMSGILRPVSGAACIVRRGWGKRCTRTLRDFDIVHLHSVFLWPTSAAAQAARKAGVPYVLSPRGMLVEDLIRRKSSLAKRAWITLFERRNIERAAAVHLTSEIEASELKALGFPHARLAVVANGIEMPRDLPSDDFDRVKRAAPMCCFWAA